MKTILSFVLSYFLATSFAFGQARAPSTEDFVKKVAVSDMMEIETSKLALDKQPDADTRSFAERMITASFDAQHPTRSEALLGLFRPRTGPSTLTNKL